MIDKSGVLASLTSIFRDNELSIESFIQKTAKTLERENDTLNRSIKNAEHNHLSDLAQDKEKLEDAQQYVEDAYTNLNPDKLKTNESQREHMETYLTSISRAEGKVLGIEEAMKKKLEVHLELIKELKAQIAVRKKRVSRLTKGIES